jgi:hypothetical protein
MCPLSDREHPATDQDLCRGRPHGARLGRRLHGLNRRDEGQRTRTRVQEREGRPFEQGREFHGIEQEVQGYEHGPRVLPIQRHARGSLERSRVHQRRERVAALLAGSALATCGAGHGVGHKQG